jgi:hypothetical protein
MADEGVALESGGAVFAAVVKPTELRHRHDFTLVRSLDRAR